MSTTESPEAIRFGSTETSGRALYAWAKQYSDDVAVGVLLREDTQAVVVIDGHTHDMRVGDYLARVPDPLDPGKFTFEHYLEAEWQLLYGKAAAQPLPEEPTIEPFEASTTPTPEKETDEPVL